MIPSDAITISVFPDGDMFCAVLTESFNTIADSPCGFGHDRKEAIAQLLLDLELAS